MKQIYGISYREGTSDEQVLHEVIQQDCYFFNQWKPKTQPKYNEKSAEEYKN